jgi:Las17-binding protein actin regulator
MMALEGGSFGFQIGGEETDFALLITNARGASGILSSKVKLGADASVAAGSVGRTASAETDATLRADILSYSRTRGAFWGYHTRRINHSSRWWCQRADLRAEASSKADRAVRECRYPAGCSETDFNTGRQDSRP